MKKEELFNLNDDELLFLMKKGSEEANKLLHQKYMYLIKKKVKVFKAEEYKNVDFMQEGEIALIKAAETYVSGNSKTFNKYFELLLNRRFISLIRKSKTLTKKNNEKLARNEKIRNMIQEAEEDLSIVVGRLSNSEMIIYTMREIENKSIKEISEISSLTPKQIYNTVSRVKQKIKKTKEEM